MGKWIGCAVFCAACGAGSAPPDATITIDSAVAIDAPAPDAIGTCSDLALPSTIVARTDVAADTPVPGGGALDPGTYLLTDWSVYTGVGGQTGPSGPTARAVISVDGTNFEYLAGLTTAAPSIGESVGTYTLSGTTDTSVETCPGTATTQYQYTATPAPGATFALYIGATEILTFTKQ